MDKLRSSIMLFGVGLLLSIFSIDTQAATPLSCGSLVSGTISTAGQVDQYSYAGNAGGMITLTLVDTAGFSGSAAYAELFDPSGGTVLGFFGANTEQQVTLAMTGTYVIQVVGGGFTSTGTYSLGLECRNPPQPATALSCGALTSGTITSLGQVNQYTYAGQAGGILTLTLVDTSGFSGSAAYARLFDPSGGTVLGFFGANSAQQVKLALTGTYVIQVVGGGFTSTGNYNLGLECRNPPQPSAALSCGAVVSGSITTLGQVDQYAYAGQAGGTLTLTLVDTSGFSGSAAYAALFDPAGNTVLGYFGANSSQRVTLAWTGTYVIQVVGGGFTSTGTYSLRLDCISGLDGEGFIPVTPCRIADTRSGSSFTGSFGPPGIAGGTKRTFPIPSSSCGIPANAQAYSFNVTVVPPAPLGYLSIWPTGELQPLVSTLNSFDGQVVANAAIVPAGSSGSVDVYASDNTDVVIDIDGYFVPIDSSAEAEAFYPDTPCRIADTRATSGFTGAFGPPIMAGGSSRTFPILSSGCSISPAAQAYSLNVTVVPPNPLDYLSLWPTGEPQPFVSTLNSFNGRVVANAAIVPAGSPDGGVDVFVSDTTDVVIDIDGHFGPPTAQGALHLYPVSPCRVADTRYGGSPFGSPSLAGGTTRDFPIPTSSCGIPSNAQAYSVNMTVIPAGPLGYLTTWPTGQPQPIVSTLNSFNGTVVANAALVPAGTSGSISVFVTDNTDLIIDIDGYFAP